MLTRSIYNKEIAELYNDKQNQLRQTQEAPYSAMDNSVLPHSTTLARSTTYENFSDLEKTGGKNKKKRG